MKSICLFFLSLLGLLVQTSANGQTIIKQNGLFGIADNNGNVILKAEFDHIRPLTDYTNTFFIIQRGSKFAYCYKVELDSTKWFPEKERHWITSEFDYDELKTMVVGLPVYSGSYSYTSIAYKKKGLWGIIYVQTKTGSGGGIFPSTGFYIEGLGKSRIREAKYDSIYRIDKDAFYTTSLNGKYGFWEPTTNEVYEPEFDSIPIIADKYRSTEFFPRHRYVKKNGKWGLVYLNKEFKKLEYKIPCFCNGLGGGGGGDYEIFYCMGQDDTLKIYDEINRTTYTPLIDGQSLKTLFYWESNDDKNFSFQDYIGSYATIFGSDSLLYLLESVGNPLFAIRRLENKKEEFPVLDSYLHNKTNSIYVVDIKNKLNLFSFTDTTFSYDIRSTLIIRAHFNTEKNLYIREFYDAQSGAFKYRIHSPEKYLYLTTSKKETKKSEIIWYKFISYTTEKSDKGKTQGYYNLTTKKFSKRRR